MQSLLLSTALLLGFLGSVAAPPPPPPVFWEEPAWEEPLWEEPSWEEGNVLEFEIVPETGINYRPLAECLTEQGWVMYGADWCPHCQHQKADFGSAFEAIEYVECVENPDLCEEMEITGYPTWVSPVGDRLSGRQDVWTLSEVSGCGF